MKTDEKRTALEAEAMMCIGGEAELIRRLLTKIGDKWSVLIVMTLANSPRHRARFSQIQKRIRGISQRMLTTTLRNLERDGMLSREVFPEVPPRVEYELTELGLSLLKPMKHLVEWIGRHWREIKVARLAFDKRDGIHTKSQKVPRPEVRN